MARRRGSRKAKGSGAGVAVIVLAIMCVLGAVVNFVSAHKVAFIVAGIIILFSVIAIFVTKKVIDKQRVTLFNEIICEIEGKLGIDNIYSYLNSIDEQIVVKSKQALDNYDDIKYFKETEALDEAKELADIRESIHNAIRLFLEDNSYGERPQYKYVEDKLRYYMGKADGYNVLVKYVTAAGNTKAEKTIYISPDRIDEIKEHPEYMMSKGEYNKFVKEQEKEELNDKKHEYYDKVNSIIDFVNSSKEQLIVKAKIKTLDELVQNLFDRTVNSIQKIKSFDSDEWGMLDKFIDSIDSQIHKLVDDDKRISDYYESDDFAKIKQTCEALTKSQKDFNDYINEKAESISKLFGTRVVRNETQNEDVFGYVRAYKKSITPFAAEVSSSVFGSAENNPIEYIIKYFYPNKSQYKEQIEKLKVLIEELETLKEAKEIIENYKKDYDQYIQGVPEFVLENDEAGFYSRLGLAIIDEAVLNVEYKFIYTSGGGMAQRSFTVPMSEENISELIKQLENKLTTKALAQEQRALMTSKLRLQIKERDNYTCCMCGNSTHSEPNLLLEIDHILPISKGGLTIEDNLQTLCWKCNRSKGAKVLEELTT